MRKGGKQNRKKQIWRVSLFRWRASWVSVCAGVGAFAAQHIVCRSVRVWVCISMDARKGQKEKNYNIFLELYPGRQLPLHFFHSFFSIWSFFVAVFSRIPAGVWSSTICRNGKIPGLHLHWTNVRNAERRRQKTWSEIYISTTTMSTCSVLLLLLLLDLTLFIGLITQLFFLAFVYRRFCLFLLLLKGAPFSDAPPPKKWKCLECLAHTAFGFSLFFQLLFWWEHISR